MEYAINFYRNLIKNVRYLVTSIKLASDNIFFKVLALIVISCNTDTNPHTDKFSLKTLRYIDSIIDTRDEFNGK